MKEEKPTILEREKKKEAGEKTVLIDKEKKAGEKRTILEDDIKIRECSIPEYEINIPSSVLATLDVHPDKGSVRFVEENGKVYLEKAGVF